MSKYIIKNCPACNFIAVGNQYRCKLLEKTDCKDCTDCLLKRIVEKCKEECEPKRVTWNIDIENFAEEILELLEIEECE